MGTPRRVIRDYRFEPEAALRLRKAVLAQQQTRYGDDPRLVVDGGHRVLPPYYPREPIDSGDPFSPSGTQVAFSELDVELQALILAGSSGGVRVRELDGSPDIDPTTIITVPNDTLTVGGAGEAVLDFNAFEMREVLLVFSALVAVGTAIDIQTGVYAGAGSPATVTNDINVTLPAIGATFKDDGRIMVLLNGQELNKGDGTGNGVAEWASATQLKFNVKIKSGGCVIVRAPFPTA